MKTIHEDIQVVDDFISGDECQVILDELEFSLWRPSLTYMLHADGVRRDVLSPLRVSETAQQQWFSDELQRKVYQFEKRLKKLVDMDVRWLESWQATNYPRRGKFYYHMDSGYWDSHYSGDRIYTFLIYLTTPEKGGGTHFRALGRKIEAKKGRLVIWNNLFANGDSNHRMIHSSMPLLKGKKTTLVTWLRQKQFRI